jgi:hypothetical protein
MIDGILLKVVQSGTSWPNRARQLGNGFPFLGNVVPFLGMTGGYST